MRSRVFVVSFGFLTLIVPVLAQRGGPPAQRPGGAFGRGNTPSAERQRLRKLLIAGQVAIALVLLVASGLLVRSFQRLRAADLGFGGTSTLTLSIGLPETTYPTRAAAVWTSSGAWFR